MGLQKTSIYTKLIGKSLPQNSINMTQPHM